MKRGMFRAMVAGAIVALACSAPVTADVLDDWNQVTIDTFRHTSGGPGYMARTAAMVHVAMYDTVNCFRGTHEPIVAFENAPRGASRVAAAAAAAHRVLVTLYPERRAVFAQALSASLAPVEDGPGQDAGVALGRRIANRVLAARANDNSNLVVEYPFGNRPGDWVLTEPGVNPLPVGPHYAMIKPWVLARASQFRPSGPGGFARLDRLLKSRLYAEQFDEVKRLGRRDSSERTTEQTEIAWFWAMDRPGTCHPPGHLLLITQEVCEQQNVKFADKARLYALVSVAMADTAIAVWDRKFGTGIDLWRPVTAIKNADLDNNAMTEKDETWEPLLEFSPPFPAYPSGHAAFGAAHAAVMARFFGRDDVQFTCGTDEPIVIDVRRTFNSFSEAARENGISRVYLGVHYRFDADASFSLGTTIGNYIYPRLASSLCPADMDDDGDVDSIDMADYTSMYFAGDSAADMNKDGSVNYTDFSMFVDAYLSGCRRLAAAN